MLESFVDFSFPTGILSSKDQRSPGRKIRIMNYYGSYPKFSSVTLAPLISYERLGVTILERRLPTREYSIRC
jgi:hypothetical protein